MSVSLNEVLTSAGFNVKNNYSDAQWLLSQRDEFEELLEIAEETIDRIEYQDEHYDGIM